MNSAATWKSGDISANGIRLHYTRTGGSQLPLVVAHGITDNGLCWTPVAAALQADWDVIMPDARGHGHSEAPETDYSLRTQVDDLAALITQLGLERPVILGHSLGAVTALALACVYPDLPRAILLEDPPDWWAAPASAPPDATPLTDWLEHVKRQTRAELRAAQRAATPHWSDAELEPWADSKMEFSLNIRQMLTPGALAFDWATLLPRITCPTLIISADVEQGAAARPAGITALKALVPQLEVAHIDGAGHSIHRDRFDPYLAAVRAFLARQRA